MTLGSNGDGTATPRASQEECGEGCLRYCGPDEERAVPPPFGEVLRRLRGVDQSGSCRYSRRRPLERSVHYHDAIMVRGMGRRHSAPPKR